MFVYTPEQIAEQVGEHVGRQIGRERVECGAVEDAIDAAREIDGETLADAVREALDDDELVGYAMRQAAAACDRYVAGAIRAAAKTVAR